MSRVHVAALASRRWVAISATPIYALVEAEDGDVRDGREAHAVLEDVRELDRAVEVDGAREGDAELLDDHADERHHRDAAVLDLDGAAAREALLVLPEGARRLDRPGVDADVGRRVDGRALAGAPPPPPKLKATAGAARRARASLAILDLRRA